MVHFSQSIQGIAYITFSRFFSFICFTHKFLHTIAVQIYKFWSHLIYSIIIPATGFDWFTYVKFCYFTRTNEVLKSFDGDNSPEIQVNWMELIDEERFEAFSCEFSFEVWFSAL